MSLAVGLGADGQREIAVLLQSEGARLGLVPRGAFDIAREAESADLASHPRVLQPARETRLVRLVQACAHRALELADVVITIGVGVIGHLVGPDEIAGAQLVGRDAKRPRARIDQALEHISRLRPAGAPIGVDGNRVGVDPANTGVERIDVVGAGRHRRAEPGNERPEQGQIGAKIAEDIDPQRQKPALGIKRHFGRGHIVAALRVADEMLAAIG